jgi:hypothetical protein
MYIVGIRPSSLLAKPVPTLMPISKTKPTQSTASVQRAKIGNEPSALHCRLAEMEDHQSIRRFMAIQMIP